LLILSAGTCPRVCLGQPHSAPLARKLKACIVQQAWRTTLEANLQAHLDAIDTAKSKGCRLVVFPEHSLFCEEVATETPKISDIDAAIQQIACRAAERDIYVVFGTHYKNRDTDKKWHPRGVVVDNKGNRQIFYEKYRDTPQSFKVDGIACNLVVCADRWYRQICDLPCLAQGVQVIVEISGGHGGDDGRPDLRFHRYPPWAQRNNAFILVANPPHYDTDDFGNSPWGGHSGIFNPDGSMEASLAYDVDKMIIRELSSLP
jgi:predicted amidohydrolase